MEILMTIYETKDKFQPFVGRNNAVEHVTHLKIVQHLRGKSRKHLSPCPRDCSKGYNVITDDVEKNDYSHIIYGGY